MADLFASCTSPWQQARALAAGLLACCALVSAAAAAESFENDYEEKPWEEIEPALPAALNPDALIPFYVSAVTENRFFVDGDSISVGADGVVRYTLVVVSATGARNVSYEGIRCDSAERRLYAFGRADGSWSKARGNAWVKIQNSTFNRQHVALFAEYFCPVGSRVADADEARRVLRAGGVQRR